MTKNLLKTGLLYKWPSSGFGRMTEQKMADSDEKVAYLARNGENPTSLVEAIRAKGGACRSAPRKQARAHPSRLTTIDAARVFA